MTGDRQPKATSAEELDRVFDESGNEIDAYLDWGAASRPGLAVKRVNIDFPQWMVHDIDREAKRRGVTRQALIKIWISDRLDSAA